MISKNRLTAVALASLALLLAAAQLAAQEKSLIDERYLDNGDGIVSDIVTNLVWQRCSVGQTWTGTTCDGEPPLFKLSETTELGDDSWRLPTIEELRTLVYCSNTGQYGISQNFIMCGDADSYQQPTVNIQAFPETPPMYFLSSSPHAQFSHDIWYASFLSGHVNHGHENGGYHVRLVRTD